MKRDRRLASAFAHFAVQDDAADQLHVEVAHVEEAAAGLADHGEGFDEQVVEGRALGQFFLEFDGFGGQIDIGKLLDGWFQVVDCGDDGWMALISRLFLVPKTLARIASIIERSRYRVEIRCYYSSAGREAGQRRKLTVAAIDRRVGRGRAELVRPPQCGSV